VAPLIRTKEVVDRVYGPAFNGAYLREMRKKLGLIVKEDPGDQDLIDSLLRTMKVKVVLVAKRISCQYFRCNLVGRRLVRSRIRRTLRPLSQTSKSYLSLSRVRASGAKY